MIGPQLISISKDLLLSGQFSVCWEPLNYYQVKRHIFKCTAHYKTYIFRPTPITFLVLGSYLLYISARECVGKIDNHNIYKIKRADMIGMQPISNLNRRQVCVTFTLPFNVCFCVYTNFMKET